MDITAVFPNFDADENDPQNYDFTFTDVYISELVKNVWPKVENGEVKPTIYKVLPITRAEEAQDILYRGENVGKVVLTID